MPRSRHTAGRSCLLHAEQVDALAAGHLHGRDRVLVDDVGDAAQLGGRGLAAPHARNHRVRAVLLDVGVRALVDEARLRIVLRLLRPGRDQVVVERRTAGRAAVGRAPFEETPSRRESTAGGARGSRRALPGACGRCSRTRPSASASPSSRRRRSPSGSARPGRCTSRRTTTPWCACARRRA